MRERSACADFYRSPLSRRQMLQVGALGTLGLSLPMALRAEAQSGLKVRAKSVIFLHQFGGPAHQDTFDMKPDAPADCEASSSRSPRACRASTSASCYPDCPGSCTTSRWSDR